MKTSIESCTMQNLKNALSCDNADWLQKLLWIDDKQRYGNVTDDFNFIQGIDTYKFRNENKNSSKVINAEFFMIINEYPEIPLIHHRRYLDPDFPLRLSSGSGRYSCT